MRNEWKTIREEIKMKYEVEVRVIEVYLVPVEADNTNSAEDIAYELVQDEASKFEYLSDANTKCTVYSKV